MSIFRIVRARADVVRRTQEAIDKLDAGVAAIESIDTDLLDSIAATSERRENLNHVHQGIRSLFHSPVLPPAIGIHPVVAMPTVSTAVHSPTSRPSRSTYE